MRKGDGQNVPVVQTTLWHNSPEGEKGIYKHSKTFFRIYKEYGLPSSFSTLRTYWIAIDISALYANCSCVLAITLRMTASFETHKHM